MVAPHLLNVSFIFYLFFFFSLFPHNHFPSSLYLSFAASPEQRRLALCVGRWSSDGVENPDPSSLEAQTLSLVRAWHVGKAETSRWWNGLLRPFLTVNSGCFMFSTSLSSKWCPHFSMKMIRSLTRISMQIKTL